MLCSWFGRLCAPTCGPWPDRRADRLTSVVVADVLRSRPSGPAGVSIEVITPTIGAEVLGVDLAEDLANPIVVDVIKAAFIDHHVLVFRDQHLDQAEHKAFGRLFGELHVHPSRRRAGAGVDPEIFVVEANADTTLNNGGLWHTDLSCEPVPPLGSMLMLTDAPPDGGDTLFATMHGAYETLSEPVRRFVDGLSAHHDQRQDLRSYGYEPRAGAEYPASTHPVVVAHPETARPLLYVNPAFTTHIEDLSAAESSAILAMLHGHVAATPSIQCRVRWEPGTLVFWDNRCTQHFAVWDYAPAYRRGERVTICADAPPRSAS